MTKIILALSYVLPITVAFIVASMVPNELIRVMVFLAITTACSTFMTMIMKRRIELKRPDYKYSQITKLEDYTPLLEAKSMLSDGRYEDALELMIQELRSAHTKNKNIYSELIHELLESISIIYSSHDVFPNFQRLCMIRSVISNDAG